MCETGVRPRKPAGPGSSRRSSRARAAGCCTLPPCSRRRCPATTRARRRLLTLALARTYACWDRLRGEDPYNRAREYLATRFAHEAWHQYAWQWYDALPLARARPHSAPGAPLARLTPQERLIVVLRLYEGVADEQVAALLGLPTERVHAVCDRATATLLHPPRGPAPAVRRAKAAAS